MVNRWLFWMDSEVMTFPDPGIWSRAVGEVPIISVKGIFSGLESADVCSVELSSVVVVEGVSWTSFSVEGFWDGAFSVVVVCCGDGSSALTGRGLVKATISERPKIIMLVLILNFKTSELFTHVLLARWALKWPLGVNNTGASAIEKRKAKNVERSRFHE